MSLGTKIHQYQTWYGEKCPYTKPAIKIIQQNPPSNEEREFIPPITKGIKTGTHKAIILGPKRERPSSAIRSTAAKAPVMPIRPISGSRVRPNRPAALLRPDSQLLKISPALESHEGSQKKNLNKPKHIERSLSKPPGVESVQEIDILTQRKIVPSVDKNYLKPRALSPKQIDANQSIELAVEETPQPPSPHPELVKRSLFVSGLRDSIKKAEECTEGSNSSNLCIQNSFSTDPQKLANFEKRLNQLENSHRPRAQTSIVPSKRSDFQFVSKSNSANRATIRGSLPTSQEKGEERSSPKTINAMGKAIATPRTMGLKSPKKSPTASEDAADEDSAGDDDLTPRDENITYALYSIVEARYKGRAHWWTGKIVQTRLDGTYDIQFGDILERHVPSSLIRPKPAVDIDTMKKKIRLTGMLASTLRESFESIQRCDSDATDMDDEPNAMPVDALLHRASSSSSSPAPPRNGSSPGGRALVRKTIVRVLSIGALSPVEESPAPKKSLLAQIAAGAHKLRKVDLHMESAAEAVAEANRRHEISEQLRLWPEIKKVVSKARCEITFDDIKVVSKLGEGKFASVHAAELTVKLHNKVFTNRDGVKRTLERLGNNLNKIQYGAKDLTLPCALKVLEYIDAYPLVGGDWEHDKPPEKDYNDREVYTDEFEVTAMEKEEIEGQRERANSMADHSDPNQQHLEQTQSFKEKYKTMPPSKSILETLREIKALTYLQHKNIVMLHGVILVPRLILVMERLQYNLAELLTTKANSIQIPLTACQRLTLLHDISNGLAFIHNNSYIHRDLKSHNVLVSSGVGGYVAKIADFGTSLHIPKGRKLAESIGTMGYTAPEVLEMPASYDISADIFSLAVIMWETLQPSDQRVDNPMTRLSPEEAPQKISDGLRPPLAHCLLPLIHPLIEKCWTTLPSARVSADEVYNELTLQLASS